MSSAVRKLERDLAIYLRERNILNKVIRETRADIRKEKRKQARRANGHRPN